MVPNEPSPLMRHLIALHGATQLIRKGAAFHMEMQQHAQAIAAALEAKAPDLPKVEPAP